MFKAFSSCESFQRSIFGKPLRQNQAVEEVPRLIFPKCSGKMKVISVIEDDEVIEMILKHLGLWEIKPRPSP